MYNTIKGSIALCHLTTYTNYWAKQGRTSHNYPHYITEKNNSDVVVADFDIEVCDLVVTERGENHRSSYIWLSYGLRLEPQGVCTGALSQILVFDSGTNTIQITDRNNMFLSYLLIKLLEIFRPVTVSYDVKTHRLWIGSCYNKKVCVYSI